MTTSYPGDFLAAAAQRGESVFISSSTMQGFFSGSEVKELAERLYATRFFGTCDGGDCDRRAVSLAYSEQLHGLIPVCRRHIQVYRLRSRPIWQAEDEFAGLRFCRRSPFRFVAQWLILLDQRAAMEGRESRGQKRKAESLADRNRP